MITTMEKGFRLLQSSHAREKSASAKALSKDSAFLMEITEKRRTNESSTLHQISGFSFTHFS